MTIYFIGGDFDRVKIGYTSSDSPAARLISLQVGSPLPLRVLAFAPGPETLEHRLHEAFAKEWLHGEWFRLSPTLREFVARVAETSDIECWRDVLAHKALGHLPDRTSARVVGPLPPRHSLEVTSAELLAAWPTSGSDADFIEHVVYGFGASMLECQWESTSNDIDYSRSGVRATAEHLAKASGDRIREFAVWVQACLWDAAPKRSSHLWYRMPHIVPFCDQIQRLAADMFHCAWPSASTQVLPIYFRLSEEEPLLPAEFVARVAEHRARIWKEHRVLAAWRENFSELWPRELRAA